LSQATIMRAQAPAANVGIRFLRLPDVCKITGLCRSMIYQLEAEQRFPSRIKLGLRAVGWVEVEVQQWLIKRIERSRGSFSTPSPTTCLSPLQAP
jgi:prophage regulatory protein